MLSFQHLVVFEAVYRHKSVTVAADMLDMPQPTLSRHLKTLRGHFGNPLFVRTKNGLEPTAQAASIIDAVSDSLEIYNQRLSRKQEFVPATSRRTFRIAASDVGHLILLHPLIKSGARSIHMHSQASVLDVFLPYNGPYSS